LESSRSPIEVEEAPPRISQEAVAIIEEYAAAFPPHESTIGLYSVHQREL